MKAIVFAGLGAIMLSAGVLPLSAEEAMIAADHPVDVDGPPREVRTGRETANGLAFGSVSRRRFSTPVETMWPLLATADGLRTWFPSAVTGELRRGGDFSIENNASGRVLRAEPPIMFRLSWIYQDNYSELELRLGSTDDGGCVVEIEHLMTAEDSVRAGMSLSEGLIAGGTGWDFTLELLDRHVRGALDPSTAAQVNWEPSADDLERFGRYQSAWQAVVHEALGEPQ